jgi:hippurate hydrolase
MASEDFAFMLNAKAGCYAWIGSGTDTPLHNPAFNFNDALIPLGALYWTALARTWGTRVRTIDRAKLNL